MGLPLIVKEPTFLIGMKQMIKMKKTAKVFKSGNSQAVRLPKAFNAGQSQFYIRKIGTSILLTPKNGSWDTFEQSLSEFSGYFMKDGRNQPPIAQGD